MAVAVYQIQYSDDIIGSFDPAFIKYDCRDDAQPERREIAHMLRFYDSRVWQRDRVDCFGLVSPKFTEKTKVSGAAFLDWISANPGYDVYFINPFPQLAYWHYNVWEQGEFWHPGVAELADSLFAAAASPIRTASLPRNTASSLLYSNYWVGDCKFWDAFMGFVGQLTIAIEHLADREREELFGLAPHYAPAAYFAFVFERMFSTFLVLHDEVSRLAFPYDHREMLRRCANDTERAVLREWAPRIDAWDELRRDDADYRALFTRLEGIVRTAWSGEAPPQDPSPVAPPRRGLLRWALRRGKGPAGR